MRRNSLATLARVLAVVLTPEQVGIVANALLCVDAEPKLNDHEAWIGQRFFDLLTDARPDLVIPGET